MCYSGHQGDKPKCPYYPVSVLSVLIWTPGGHAEVSVLSGVRIKCVNTDTKGDKPKCPYYPVSVLSGFSKGKMSRTLGFIDIKIKADNFTATENVL